MLVEEIAEEEVSDGLRILRCIQQTKADEKGSIRDEKHDYQPCERYKVRLGADMMIAADRGRHEIA